MGYVSPKPKSPREMLVEYQLRRENRALLDAFEEQRAKEDAADEARRERDALTALKLQEAEKKNQEMERKSNDMEKEFAAFKQQMAQQLKQHDEEIKRSHSMIQKEVTQKGLARSNSATGHTIASVSQTPQLPMSAVVAAQQPTFLPPHRRYELRGTVAAPAEENNTDNTNNTASAGKDNTNPRANHARKRSYVGSEPRTPVARPRSVSTSSTLSSIPSSPPVLPDLPFNKKGTPTQADLGIDVYFKAAVRFARERGVSEESDDAQVAFIMQIFKGMKKEERSELVASLEKISLTVTDESRRTVQFLCNWDELAGAVDDDMLMDAKAKAALLRAVIH